MSSAEPNNQILVPAGLPATYIGAYAAIGIASLVYITAMMSAPGGTNIADPNLQATGLTEAATPTPVAIEDNNAKPQSTASNQTDLPEASSAPVIQADTEPAEETVAAEAAANPNPNIETKYVTTQQILASRQPSAVQAEIPANRPAETSREASMPDTLPTAIPQRERAIGSNIVTGSITIPPPPERAPQPPAIVRTALKPALSPSDGGTARKTVAARPAAPSAPVEFGAPVVTAAETGSEQSPSLAVLLATGSSVESLRLTWNLLQERHSAALYNLSPRYIVEQNPAAPERRFALLAGPVVSATDVARVCGALVSEGLTCRTRTFAGNSL